MIIREMFAKPIDRDIKGVIKVGQDDSANVKQELEEYVVTRELQKHFADFFSSYKKGITGNTDKMGVWISGFFGSGKSHFLKILSYILGNNRIVDGRHAIDYFADGKMKDNIVFADMKLAASVPTDVILFNIDSKSEMTGKQSKDAIVSVFLHVFNEMQGFCGSIPFVADLERKLTEDGKYDEFKSRFEASNKKSWSEARSDFDFIQDDIVEILSDMNFMSEEAARNWCEKATETYNISIENFAKMVKKYIDSKSGNRHVVFLADEMGQYIGEDSKLMLNLQTVTEDLGRICNGKAWVIITSQQDIDSITKTKSNDFSKITGRFDTRLSLSSANVDEVIKKRILEKTEQAQQTLELLYDQKSTVIKNLIVFNDGPEKKLYTERSDFGSVYPFIPYQFNLLGSVLTAIREHGASGKHLAEGERSMIALFKESAVKIMNTGTGSLIPFNLFYDALEQFLDHSHRGVILKALDNDSLNPGKEKECFDVNVLKTLFMIKYVKEIKANINNITSLMIDNINNDRIELTKKVEEALRRLCRQTLVQKNGDLYVFLTNEEQEINRAIDNMNVENADVISKISEMIFDGIYAVNKYSYPQFNGRYAFQFNQAVDDRWYKGNQKCDIGLKILTPGYGAAAEDSMMRLMSTQDNNVLIALSEDMSYIDEVRSSLKIEKYLRANAGSTLKNYEQIKSVKSAEMTEHKSNAVLFLTEALKAGRIFVNGDNPQIASKEISSRINDAMSKLVAKVYHKLSYIDTPVGIDDIRKLLKETNQIGLNITTGKQANQLASDDILDFIAQKSLRHEKTSMKALIERFIKPPYGFIEDDILWVTAKLFKNGDIALYLNNEVITLMNKTGDDIIKYLTKHEFGEKLLMERRQKAKPMQKKSVKEIMKTLFNVSSVNDDDDALMSSFKKYASDMKTELCKTDIIYKTTPAYPGKQIIKEGIRLMTEIGELDHPSAFYESLDANRDTYLSFADQYGPVKSFFDGEQKTLFDKSLNLMKIYEDSKNFISDKSVSKAYADVKEVIKKESPYSEIYKLPELNAKFWELYIKLLDALAVPVNKAIEEARSRVFAELKNKKCHDSLSDSYVRQWEEIRDKAKVCNNIATLQNIKIEADALKNRMLNEIAEKEAALTPPTIIGGKPITPVIPTKKHKHVSIKAINIEMSWQIETKDDIERYVETLKKQLLDQLETDTIISVEF